MKRLFAVLVGFVVAASSSWSLDFRKVDSMLGNGQIAESQKLLEEMLPQAKSSSEKAEVLWRLARGCVAKGQLEKTKDGKKAVFGQGIEYAAGAIEADPNNPQCYMWHCANVGRECQTKPLLEQASAVPVMTKDLTYILDDLKLVKCSEAWQALAEIYFNHPMKSNDAAANFTRTALASIPSGELRLSTYALLAEILSKRGWTAEKRAAAFDAEKAKFAQTSKTITKYSYFSGSLGSSHVPAWSSKPLGSMSDREEAKALVDYAIGLYDKSSRHTSTDKDDYKTLTALRDKLN